MEFSALRRLCSGLCRHAWRSFLKGGMLRAEGYENFRPQTRPPGFMAVTEGAVVRVGQESREFCALPRSFNLTSIPRYKEILNASRMKIRVFDYRNSE